mmetsp:Transcript_58464/g.137275  ORF Transcript_58464/g.137275 Transcript_58464/m.137275 type:complete len:1840 (+) Transcript_58464:176-5695(+)
MRANGGDSPLRKAQTVGPGSRKNLSEGAAGDSSTGGRQPQAWLEVGNVQVAGDAPAGVTDKRISGVSSANEKAVRPTSLKGLKRAPFWADSNAVIVGGYTPQERAAAIIWRWWQQRKYSSFIKRDTFADRLDLEDAVGKGVVRLAVYSLMFVFIVFALEVGVPDSAKLDAKKLITDELALTTLYSVGTLQGLRDFLPALSDNFKRFSSSSNIRFSREDGFIVAQKRVELVRSKTMFSFDPEVTGGSFTLASWVERLSGGRSTGRLSILRKPMRSHRALNCWGWFLTLPAGFPELRFGAHDFHSLNDTVADVEEVIALGDADNGAGVPEGVLSHEVLVVDGLVAKFYRDGKLLGSRTLPRPLTDCINPDPVELGDVRIALSAVKFYARALSDSEVEEMFQGGAPLVEVATGSKLGLVVEDELLQVGVEVKDGKKETLEAIDLSSEYNMVSSKVGLSAEDNHLPAEEYGIDPKFPFDPAPPAVLPRGMEPALVKMLPDGEKAIWEEAGRPMTGLRVEQFVPDPVWEGTEHFSLVEEPMHGDGSAGGRLPILEDATDGITMSFWFKSYELSRGHGPNMIVERVAQDGYPAMKMEFNLELDWVWISLSVEGVGEGYVWSFLTVFDESTGRIDEQYLLYSFAQNPAPLVWRHLLWQYDGATGKFAFFLDGKQVIDVPHYEQTKYTSWEDLNTAPFPSASTVFSNATVTPHSWDGGSKWQTIPGKIAQLRVYTRILTPDEIEELHKSSSWPAGDSVRQCINPHEDYAYSDSVEVDGKGHDCSWFATVEKHSPYICAQTWAKNMCPVTCSGKRLCHDGSLLQSRPPTPPRRKFRVFDRVMHIKPIKPVSPGGSESIICPSDRVSREQVISECEEWAALDQAQFEATGRGIYAGSWNFTRHFDRTFKLTKPADIRDCQLLAERMDETQCQWNASWMDDFQEDYEETGSYSISFWLKPTETSLGMPNNFWFAISLFSTLAPPLLLGHWNEIQPTLEPWMDVYANYNDASGTVRGARASVWPTSLIDYSGGWTFFYMHVERLDEAGNHRMCATLDGIPLACRTFVGENAFPGGRFLEGIEFTTEMLVSPIEVGTETLSPSEVQKKYYRREVEMQKIFGPKGGKTLRSEPKTSESFDNKLILMAPPVVFQTRKTAALCNNQLTAPIVAAQLVLTEAAHCSASICPNLNTQSLITCQGGPDTGKYFGRSLNTLGGSHGHADFLYTIADNPVLVRDGVLLDAEKFIDTLTSTAMILAVFQDPATGLISQLQLKSELSGKTVLIQGQFSHYGFVTEEENKWLKYNYGMLFALVFVAIVANIHFAYDLFRHAKKTEEPVDMQGMAEVVYDILMALLVCIFGIFALIYATNTESKGMDFVHRIARIPFASPGVPFEEKVSQFFETIDVLNSELASAELLSSCAFCIMVLMLVRIVHATAVHPRLKVLVGTLYHAMTDLWHFAMLLVVVFFFFSFTAKWMFSKDRDDFRDLRASMKTQFEVLMGRTPKDFETETKLTVFICFTVVVQFFLMRHFLLAIIMQGYLKLRREVEENEAERGFIEDVIWTFDAWLRSKLGRWPSRRRVTYILRKKIGAKRVCFIHLKLQMPDVSTDRLLGFWNYYTRMSWIRCDPPAHLLPPNTYADFNHDYFVRSKIDEIHRIVHDEPPIPETRPSLKRQNTITAGGGGGRGTFGRVRSAPDTRSRTSGLEQTAGEPPLAPPFAPNNSNGTHGTNGTNGTNGMTSFQMESPTPPINTPTVADVTGNNFAGIQDMIRLSPRDPPLAPALLKPADPFGRVGSDGSQYGPVEGSQEKGKKKDNGFKRLPPGAGAEHTHNQVLKNMMTDSQRRLMHTSSVMHS